MEAVIFCCNHVAPPEYMEHDIPFCLFPVGDKPIIRQMLESCAHADVVAVTLFVTEGAAQIQDSLERSSWDIELRYVVLDHFKGLGQALELILDRLPKRFLLFTKLLLPPQNLKHLKTVGQNSHNPVVFCEEKGEKSEVLSLSREYVENKLLHGALSANDILQRLPSRDCEKACAMGFGAFSISDIEDVYNANLRMFEESASWLSNDGCDRDDTVLRGPKTKVNTESTLVPPALLGAHVVCEQEAVVGPYAVIGAGSVLGKASHIRDSVIFPGSYIPPQAHIENAFVIRGLVISFPTWRMARLMDTLPEANSTLSYASDILSIVFQRCLAALALLCVSPLLAPFLLWRILNPKTTLVQSVLIADKEHVDEQSKNREIPPTLMHTFRAKTGGIAKLPALYDVLMGRLNLVGVEPLPMEQAVPMTKTWPRGRFAARPGLINPWRAYSRKYTWDEAEKRVMELYYIRTRSLANDLTLLAKSMIPF